MSHNFYHSGSLYHSNVYHRLSIILGKEVGKGPSLKEHVESLTDSLPPSHAPGCWSTVQTGKNILHTRSCAPVFPPTLSDDVPQCFGEPKLRRILRFLQSNPLYDGSDNCNIVHKIVVWDVTT